MSRSSLLAQQWPSYEVTAEWLARFGRALDADKRGQRDLAKLVGCGVACANAREAVILEALRDMRRVAPDLADRWLRDLLRAAADARGEKQR